MNKHIINKQIAETLESSLKIETIADSRVSADTSIASDYSNLFLVDTIIYSAVDSSTIPSSVFQDVVSAIVDALKFEINRFFEINNINNLSSKCLILFADNKIALL